MSQVETEETIRAEYAKRIAEAIKHPETYERNARIAFETCRAKLRVIAPDRVGKEWWER